MSDTGVYDVLRVVRTVRRSETIGAAGGRVATGTGGFNYYNVIAGLGLAAVVTGQPELLALIVPLIGISAYNAYVTGTPDQQRQRLLENIYGKDEGDKLYGMEWSHRQIEIDLRSKAP